VWETVQKHTEEVARKRYGSRKASDGVDTANISNGDAVTLVRAWTQQAGTGGFPLWYQFAAAAYGWEPKQGDALDTTAKRRDAMLDIDIGRELWAATKLMARDLDDAKITARLELDEGAFDDPVIQGQVKAALRGDGAMRAQFKIPVGCKDKNGKVSGPKLKCREGFELENVTGTPFFVCRNKKTGEVEEPKWECDPVTVDDPITGVKKKLGREFLEVALILGFIYLVVKHGDDD
jgi:hypothetical protein